MILSPATKDLVFAYQHGETRHTSTSSTSMAPENWNYQFSKLLLGGGSTETRMRLGPPCLLLGLLVPSSLRLVAYGLRLTIAGG